MKNDELNILCKKWHTFPQNVLYLTSKQDLVVNPNKGVFVYSIHHTTNPVYKKLKVASLYFRVYTFHADVNNTEPSGYAFFPTIPNDFKVRYNPIAVVATGPQATLSAVLNAEKKSLLSNDYLEMIWLSFITP